MFSTAYSIATCFTRPVVVSTAHENGDVRSAAAAFIVVNSDGWIITAAHVLAPWPKAQAHAQERRKWSAQVQAVRDDPSLRPALKKKRLAHLKPNPEWIVHLSPWWNWDGVTVTSLTIHPLCDLAIGRLQPFDPSWVTRYPRFKDPAKPMPPGTSLCRLGFPFHEIKASCDPLTGNFTLAPGSLPVPFFPIEGIYTREIIVQADNASARFVETSSPGLRGQSGGPIFDVNGTVWAIQSRTAHLPLGFSPKLKLDNKEVEEHQFLNVGHGAHPDEIVKALSNSHVRFELADY